jgi:hypothetical protein
MVKRLHRQGCKTKEERQTTKTEASGKPTAQPDAATEAAKIDLDADDYLTTALDGNVAR